MYKGDVGVIRHLLFFLIFNIFIQLFFTYIFYSEFMQSTKGIYINQIGYFCNETKIGYVCSDENSSVLENPVFYVKTLDGKEVFSGKLTEPLFDEMAGETICTADFTQLKDEGNYVLCAGNNSSYPFKIGTDVYKDLYYSSLRYYYLSRCGCDTEDPVFGHKACHCGEADIYGTKLTKTVLGGWHDAGDYGRYIVAGTKTVMDLLFAYEAEKNHSEFNILEEVRFELEWMLRLQREDGAVYHKISCYRFCGFIEPEKELDRLVLAPVSTSATADFAGCLAYASTFYKDSDPAFAENLLDAAKNAQTYLDSHEDEIYTNPPEITTGGYGDINVKDERYFGLCGLFYATKNPEYLEKAIKAREIGKNFEPENKPAWYRGGWNESFGWGSVAGYGSELLLKVENCIEDKALIQEIKEAFIRRSEEFLSISEKQAFGVCSEWIGWGSNGAVCDCAHTLLLTAGFTGQQKYVQVAKKQLDYILGCNPNNICYVTGNGTAYTKFPHHRPSGALKKLMPGMLAGGPDSGLHDAEAKKYLEGKAPLKCYIDVTQSYSTNEVAIYWNSPMVNLIACVAAMNRK